MVSIRNKALATVLFTGVTVVSGFASGYVWSEVLSNNTAIVHHDSAYFNCCPDMEFQIEVYGDSFLVKIYEKDLDTHPCDCMCDFDFAHRLEGLAAGTYAVQVWEDNAFDTQGFQLAGTTQLVIPQKVSSLNLSSIMSECGGFIGVRERRAELNVELSSRSIIRSPVEISYILPQATWVELSIYDVTGTKVKVFETGVQEPGEYSLFWDLHNQRGKTVPQGIYFVRLETETGQRSLPIIVVK
jgi:hypothetical protein